MKNSIEILKNMSILYAEDDAIVRESTVNVLKFFFKSVLVVDNGADALKMYEKSKPNILLLDIRMPFVNGLEVARVVRQKDDKTPIIINTSYQESEDFLKAIKLNLVEFLIKPFTFEQLRLSFIEAIVRMEKNGVLCTPIDEHSYYDFMQKSILREGGTIALTKNEIIVLEELLISKGALVNYSRLEEALRGEYDASKAAIKNIILRLRKKIGKDKIVNVQDLGYLLL
jgi:DNA-binding response OmpR family regulator